MNNNFYKLIDDNNRISYIKDDLTVVSVTSGYESCALNMHLTTNEDIEYIKDDLDKSSLNEFLNAYLIYNRIANTFKSLKINPLYPFSIPNTNDLNSKEISDIIVKLNDNYLKKCIVSVYDEFTTIFVANNFDYSKTHGISCLCDNVFEYCDGAHYKKFECIKYDCLFSAEEHTIVGELTDLSAHENILNEFLCVTEQIVKSEKSL